MVRLSSKSDQHQNSPCTMNTLQDKLVMRIKDMITQDHRYFLNSLIIHKENSKEINVY